MESQRMKDLRQYSAGATTGVRLEIAYLLEELDARDLTIQRLLKGRRPIPRVEQSVHRIVAVVGEKMGVSPAEIFGPDRFKRVARARQLAVHIARLTTSLSFPELGRSFGGRDHTSMIYSSERGRLWALQHPDRSALLDECLRELATQVEPTSGQAAA